MTTATRYYSETWVQPADVAVMRSFEPGHVPPRSQSHIVDSPIEHRYHDNPETQYSTYYTIRHCPECNRAAGMARLRPKKSATANGTACCMTQCGMSRNDRLSTCPGKTRGELSRLGCKLPRSAALPKKRPALECLRRRCDLGCWPNCWRWRPYLPP